MSPDIILPGRPATKKNHQQIFKTKGRTHLAQSDFYLRYETECLWRLKGYSGTRYKPNARINLCALYYMPDRRSWPDLIGLLQATSDILEKAGIYANDRDIVSYDGSRIAGIDKLRPRVEIFITEEE